jgi:AraC family transcriptional regulator
MSEPGVGDGDLRHGLASYGKALRVAGGTEVEALIRGDSKHGVGAALYVTPPFEVNVPALPVARLSVTLTNARGAGGVQGEPLRGFVSSRYSLFFTPAGAAMTFRKDAPSRHINVYFTPHVLDTGEGTGSPLLATHPMLNAVVPGVRNLIDQLVVELRSPVMLQADAAESLARLLLVQVARHWMQRSARARTLHPALLAKLRDYVMAHLGDRILVADLAAQAGMSLDTFAVAYKEQTGLAPHQFVLALRLEHAVSLLRLSGASVSEVAHVCGFASQQHLTNVMSRQLGVTPGRYRDSMRAAASGTGPAESLVIPVP